MTPFLFFHYFRIEIFLNSANSKTFSFVQVKLLTLSSVGKVPLEETQDERQGKMLLHTEHSLLSLLKGMEGVVQKHDFFTELCLHEEEVRKRSQSKTESLRFIATTIIN